jgi:prolyl oligopeptidase
MWMPDGSGFLYRQLTHIDTKRGHADPLSGMPVRWHRLGISENEDPTVLSMEGSQPSPISPETSPSIDVSPQSPWVLAQASQSRSNLTVCLARWPRGVPDSGWSCPIRTQDEVRRVVVHANTLYVLTTRNAPMGRVVALSLPPRGEGLDRARDVFSGPPGAVLSGMSVARDALYVAATLGVVDQLYRVSFTGYVGRAPMPFAGSIARNGLLKDLSASLDEDGVIFSLESWLEPRRLYLFDQEGVLNLQGKALKVTGYEDLATLETVATSTDGTAVPLSIVYRKDIKLDGKNRAIVSAYGGYGVMSAPTFQPLMLEWVRAGGVWATAHVRGGGELGENWHRSGQGPNKGRGVEDLVACSRELARRGYTSPERTALMGSSMGAILVGGAITRFPESFSAAVIRSGLLNPLRILHAINGMDQIREIGDPREPKGFHALLAMDPYQNIHPGRHYPAVLLMVGLNDHRVANWMTGKFGARLRAVFDPSPKPVWIRVTTDNGHFPISASQQSREYGDVFGFLDAQLPDRAHGAGEPEDRQAKGLAGQTSGAP